MTEAADSQVAVFASHGLVLLHLARRPDCTMREMSVALEISERRIARIVRDLTDGEVISITKIGRRNYYHINEEAICLPSSISDAKLGAIVRAVLRRPTEEGRGEGEHKILRSFLHGFFFPIAADEEVAEFLPSLLMALV